ncbi:MAG: DUF4197 domain-containing protein [Myxococcota bacterium]
MRPTPSRPRSPRAVRSGWRWLAALWLAMSGPGCADFQLADLAAVLEAGQPLSESTVADGLREALRVGTERAATTLSRPGGFADNPLLRLSLPEELDPMTTALRTIGLGGPVDELEATMNRAAERAAGEAIPVFASAISSMTLTDAMGILEGPPDAATRYFEKRTSAALEERFAPVVRDAMTRVGLYASYRELVSRYEAIPFVKPVAPDLESYVSERTLVGLFDTLADEEEKIREDPAARTTALLRSVFGSRSPGAAPAR